MPHFCYNKHSSILREENAFFCYEIPYQKLVQDKNNSPFWSESLSINFEWMIWPVMISGADVPGWWLGCSCYDAGGGVTVPASVCWLSILQCSHSHYSDSDLTGAGALDTWCHHSTTGTGLLVHLVHTQSYRLRRTVMFWRSQSQSHAVHREIETE